MFGDRIHAVLDIHHHAALLWLTSLNVCMRTVSTVVDNDPLPPVKNPANYTLNESDVDRLESTKHGVHVLPESLLPSHFALLDNCEEKCLGFLDVEL